MKKWRLIFMGTPAFAVPILRALLKSRDEVVAVVTQPDKPAGRGKRLTPPPVKVLAEKHGIPVFQPQKLKDPSFLNSLASLAPHLIVVAAYGKILPKEILDLPQYGCLNVHASLLPKFRGAAPINWAIISGEKETGVTIMVMDEGMDTGDILLQEAVSIGPEETAGELHDCLAELGARLIIKAIEGLKKGTLVPRKQPEEGVSYAPMLKKEDGLLDFSRSAWELSCLIRGLDPWPSAYTYFHGRLLKLFRPEVIEETVSASPGQIVDLQGALTIATGKGLLKIKEVQPEGKRRMKAEEFIRGYHPKLGERLPS